MRTKAVIHLDRFKENFNAIKSRIGKNKHICVSVKANAYGHGALQIAKKSLELGAHCLGVATVAEGVSLRKSGIKASILLLSQSHPDEIPEIIKARITPFISDTDFASILNKQVSSARIKLPVHIKIDTGMGRGGCSVKDALSLAKHVAKCSALKLTGTATHLAAADSANLRDIEYTNQQLSRFKKAVAAIKAARINPGIVHAANSGGIILHPESWLDMVRPGILLYGYKAVQEYELPLSSMKKLTKTKLKTLLVEPVMELRSTVSLIKKIKKGESVSYGRTWTAETDTFIAILPVGYADGLPRLASNKWQAVINGEAYRLIGRVCMDQCCIDLGPKPVVQRWDEAVIFGQNIIPEDANAQIIMQDAAALADTVGTIPYEITCGISSRVPRVYR